MNFLYKDESYVIRGAIYEVYKEMGCGFLEAIYQECLEREMLRQGIPFLAQQELEVFYKGQLLNQNYKPDLICYNKIIIELKSVAQLLPQHEAQIMNYLKATKFNLGFLVNFSAYPGVEIKRFVI